MIIYKITNKNNGKVYIGQTTQSLHDRWRKHRASNSGCKALHSAIVKYGVENFVVEQIDVACDRSELDRKEEYWIKYYDCISPKGYNLTAGGEHPIMSEETRKKLSQSKKGVHVDNVISDKCRMTQLKSVSGKPLSEEHRKKISEANKGKVHSNESRKKMSEARKGIKFSDEHCKKLSETHKGKYLGAERYNAKKVLCVETGVVYDSLSTAGRAHNVNHKNISLVCAGKRKLCGGYHWRFAS